MGPVDREGTPTGKSPDAELRSRSRGEHTSQVARASKKRAPGYPVTPAPPFPENFSSGETDALRALLLLARGQGTGWDHIRGLKRPGLDKQMLGRFAHGGSNLNRDLVKHIYEQLHSFLVYDAVAIRSVIQPLFLKVYRNRNATIAQPGWEILDQRNALLRAATFEEDIAACEGIYSIYRYGTDSSDDGEIIQSAISVSHCRKDKRLFFEGYYPPSSGADPEDRGFISGNIESLPNYYWFLGYDHSNGSPYLLALKKSNKLAAKPKYFNGMLLRRTQKGDILAARVFIERAETWDLAFSKVAKMDIGYFEQHNPGKLDFMRDQIDNQVDNKSNFALMGYIREKKKLEKSPIGASDASNEFSAPAAKAKRGGARSRRR